LVVKPVVKVLILATFATARGGCVGGPVGRSVRACGTVPEPYVAMRTYGYYGPRKNCDLRPLFEIRVGALAARGNKLIDAPLQDRQRYRAHLQDRIVKGANIELRT
jgi:hypothetical protein